MSVRRFGCTLQPVLLFACDVPYGAQITPRDTYSLAMPICIPFSYIKGQKMIAENSTPSWKIDGKRRIKLVLSCKMIRWHYIFFCHIEVTRTSLTM